MSPLLIYASRTSGRLVYVLDWLFCEQLKTGYRLTHNKAEASQCDFVISYGPQVDNGLSIPDAGLLWEAGIQLPVVNVYRWNDLPVLFPAEDNTPMLPFDIFSAIFFLLSRQEEYVSFTPDKHGRYPATESILYKNNLLEQPIIDEWVQRLREILVKHYFLTLPDTQFSYQPTYDIDIAWSYKHKGLLRNAGALAGDLIAGRIKRVSGRISVLTGKAIDPYDSYEWMGQLHRECSITPLYFILASLQTTAFDKNISPGNEHMRSLVSELNNEGFVGLHPSYYSDAPGVLLKEKQELERITGKLIQISRQHYIRFALPETYRALVANGILEDYSMGYGTHLGFRAGTGQSFLWYDLEQEQVTALRIHPFCFMDTTAHFELGLPAKGAFTRLSALTEKLRHTNSRLITVLHNFSLGTDLEWEGWKEAYYAFVKNHA